ncbi:MAG: STAS domain-containing protein [Bacteroidales bacterium]|nr:STAS domain-containing protein [Bacteroidales bacterium]
MLKTERINGVVVVKFNNIDRFNALITEPVKEQLKNLFSKPDIKLALSLDGIRFIDSTGFGVFLSIMKTANNKDGQFKICDISPEVMELFKLLQLHNVFDLYDNLDDCLKGFTK